MLVLQQSILPRIPTDGAPAATAANAYSICTNFPDGLRNGEMEIVFSLLICEFWQVIMKSRVKYSAAECNLPECCQREAITLRRHSASIAVDWQLKRNAIEIDWKPE